MADRIKIGRCKNCKHFWPDQHETRRRGFVAGNCGLWQKETKIVLRSSTDILIDSDETTKDPIMGGDFGCVLFEQKDTANG